LSLATVDKDLREFLFPSGTTVCGPRRKPADRAGSLPVSNESKGLFETGSPWLAVLELDQLSIRPNYPLSERTPIAVVV
jgi:hypothetical protein